jgi:hypothetical protein
VLDPLIGKSLVLYLRHGSATETSSSAT